MSFDRVGALALYADALVEPERGLPQRMVRLRGGPPTAAGDCMARQLYRTVLFGLHVNDVTGRPAVPRS